MSGLSKITLALTTLLSASMCQASPRTISPSDSMSPLRLERTIALPDVAGRIDHLAIDARNGHVAVGYGSTASARWSG